MLRVAVGYFMLLIIFFGRYRSVTCFALLCYMLTRYMQLSCVIFKLLIYSCSRLELRWAIGNGQLAIGRGDRFALNLVLV